MGGRLKTVQNVVGTSAAALAPTRVCAFLRLIFCAIHGAGGDLFQKKLEKYKKTLAFVVQMW